MLSVKIAIITESFLPHMNGVTGSVLQIVKQLSSREHELLIVAPDAGAFEADLHGAKVEFLKSLPLPAYREVRVVTATKNRIERILHSFAPDVVHLASPFVLGWAGVRAAAGLGIPTVAVYQTDIVAYTTKYRLAGTSALAQVHIARLHRRASITLTPSSSARKDLEKIGVDRLRHWGRGVDADRFSPDRRDEAWRRDVAGGKTVVGYVGRLSPEKQVEDLIPLSALPDVKLVIVGDGPSRPELEQLMPEAHFAGFQGGDELPRILASCDIFVHPGESETFCQTIQEAFASGVPAIATGSAGPLDLIHNGKNGWLYEPGNLDEMRDRVRDLAGDSAKRAAFSRMARLSARDRSWSALTDELLGHYREAIELQPLDAALVVRSHERPRSAAPSRSAPAPLNCSRYIALGDSYTEGLGDTSRMPAGEYLGWASRLAMLLADGAPDAVIDFANLAVRSRRVRHLPGQVDAALRLGPDLVSILIGANDLVRTRVNIPAILATLESEVELLRRRDLDVLLSTLFLPRRNAARPLARRFAMFNDGVRRIAVRHECRLVDTDTIPEIGDPEMWAFDRVHLSSTGHRLLAYKAAESLGVPDAHELRALEHSLHDDTEADVEAGVSWLRSYALPWMWRRARGRTAGDGMRAKHSTYVRLPMGNATWTGSSQA